MPPASRRARRPARRKPANPVNWTAWLGGLLAASILVGCLFSPMTSLRRVRVIGAPAVSHERLERDLKLAEGIPYPLLSQGWLANRMTLDGSLASFKVDGNIFGRAVIRATPREAIAAVKGQGLPGSLLMDRTGRLFVGEPKPALPVLTVSARVQEASMMLGSGWEAGAAAALMDRLGRELKGEPFAVEASEESTFLVTARGRSVRLGAIVDLDRAMQDVLERLGPAPAPE